MDCVHNHLTRVENMQVGTYQCDDCGELLSAGPYADRTEIVMGVPK